MKSYHSFLKFPVTFTSFISEVTQVISVSEHTTVYINSFYQNKYFGKNCPLEFTLVKTWLITYYT